MPEIMLLCPACEQSFVFTDVEQARCAEQAFPPPTYCPECHDQRKRAKDAERDKHRGGSKRRRR